MRVLCSFARVIFCFRAAFCGVHAHTCTHTSTFTHISGVFFFRSLFFLSLLTGCLPTRLCLTRRFTFPSDSHSSCGASTQRHAVSILVFVFMFICVFVFHTRGGLLFYATDFNDRFLSFMSFIPPRFRYYSESSVGDGQPSLCVDGSFTRGERADARHALYGKTVSTACVR
jgi:hypothetical protein